MLKNSLFGEARFLGALRTRHSKIGWGTSEFSVRAACEVRSSAEMVSSGDIPSDFNLASFSTGPIFEFFNTIGAEQPFARWPVLGAWLRGLNDRSEKGVCISLIGSIAAKIRPSHAYEGGNSFLRVIGSAGRDDGIFFCCELIGQTGFE